MKNFRERLRSLSFRQQAWLWLGLFLVNALLAHIFHCGLFHNLSWVLGGLLFLLHPVLPQGVLCCRIYPEQARLGMRIGSGLVILPGLITRFGI